MNEQIEKIEAVLEQYADMGSILLIPPHNVIREMAMRIANVLADEGDRTPEDDEHAGHNDPPSETEVNGMYEQSQTDSEAYRLAH